MVLAGPADTEVNCPVCKASAWNYCGTRAAGRDPLLVHEERKYRVAQLRRDLLAQVAKSERYDNAFAVNYDGTPIDEASPAEIREAIESIKAAPALPDPDIRSKPCRVCGATGSCGEDTDGWPWIHIEFSTKETA